MEDRPRKQGRLFAAEELNTNFIEEMNLVEYPLVVLADEVPVGVKTLTFEDSIFDKASGEYIKRRCIVTGSDHWGLPNWFDMDIMLALMQITKRQNNFRERTVYFSLCRLRDELGYKHGRYIERLKTGLLRICGTTIIYENAWRQNGRWLSTEAFHLLDNVRLSNTKQFYDPDTEQCLKWNDRVVESIQRSNTKKFDWEFYKSLKRPTAKRLYRFLDKRFSLRGSWQYELTEFCPNKIGMKRELPAWRYRDNLKPGIAELVQRGFLRDLPAGKLFTKEGKVSHVNFQRSRKQFTREAKPAPEPRRKPELKGVAAELKTRGVANAEQLVATYSEERIIEQIENFDDRNKHGESKSAGWLRKAIEDDYGFRKGFKSTAQRRLEEEARDRKQREKARAEAKERAELEADREHTQEAKKRYLAIRGALSKEEQVRLEDAALEKEERFTRQLVLEARRKGDVESIFYQMLWERHIIPSLGEASLEV